MKEERSKISTGQDDQPRRIRLLNPTSKLKLELRGDDVLADEAGNHIPLKNGVWRFASEPNYTDSFGFQWNKFQKTQIDRFQDGLKQSSERFLTVTRWDKEDLVRKNILEVGSGAGRFTRVVLEQTAATLHSVDFSDAVTANYNNNGPNPRLHLYQASIYELPFEPHQFDKVFCFGVLQHTPDFRKSIGALAEMVSPGGELIVDFYPIRGWFTRLHAKYIFRPFTKRMDREQLLSLIERHAPKLIGAYSLFDRMGLGKVLNRFLPICDIKTTLPAGLDEDTLREWVILDTFDMFSPAHDQPQYLGTVKNWFDEFGMKEVSGAILLYGDHNSVTFVRGKR